MAKDTPITIRLDADEARALNRFLALTKRNKSDVLREAMHDFLMRNDDGYRERVMERVAQLDGSESRARAIQQSVEIPPRPRKHSPQEGHTGSAAPDPVWGEVLEDPGAENE